MCFFLNRIVCSRYYLSAVSGCCLFFFFSDTATTEIYTYCHTLSLHGALPISPRRPPPTARRTKPPPRAAKQPPRKRSEEHTSELQSLIRFSYAVFCLKKKNLKLTTEFIYCHIV